MSSQYYYTEHGGHTVEMPDGRLFKLELSDRMWGYDSPVWRMELQITRVEADVSAKEPYYAQCSIF